MLTDMNIRASTEKLCMDACGQGVSLRTFSPLITKYTDAINMISATLEHFMSDCIMFNIEE